jgi:hypothetical protein
MIRTTTGLCLRQKVQLLLMRDEQTVQLLPLDRAQVITQNLDANKNYNQKAGGLAGNIHAGLQNQASGIQNNINTAQNKFQTEADKKHITYDQNTVDQAINNPTGFVYNDGNTEAVNQANLDKFIEQRDAQYTGPSQLDSSNSLYSQAQGFKNTANLTNSQNGRFGLLSSMFGKPSYTSGQQGLDNFMLQGNKQQLDGLQKVRSLGSSLPVSYNSAVSDAQNIANTYTNEANVARHNTREALYGSGEKNPGAIGAFAKEAEAARDKYKTAIENAKTLGDAIPSLNLSKAQAEQLGIDANMRIPGGIDPSTYFSRPDATATVQNSISEDQYNKIQALSKLAGNTASGNAFNILSQFGGQKHAGEMEQLDPYTFDLAKLKADSEARLNEYNDKVNHINEMRNTKISGEGIGNIDLSKIPISDLSVFTKLLADLEAEYNPNRKFNIT